VAAQHPTMFLVQLAVVLPIAGEIPARALTRRWAISPNNALHSGGG
jgi:hypothetical protein